MLILNACARSIIICQSTSHECLEVSQLDVCRRQLVEPVLEFIFDNLLLSTQDGTSRVRTTGHVIPFHSIYLYPLANGGRCVVAMLDNQPEESSSSSS